VASWRGDSDLWAYSTSGEPLGIGELQLLSYRQIRSDTGSPLARLDGGDLLLCRANVTEARYFCATLPSALIPVWAQDGLAFTARCSVHSPEGRQCREPRRRRRHGVGETDGRQQPSDPVSREQLLSSRWLRRR
jgi:hypothetical protein